MKAIISRLNPAFDNRNRLGIMALLVLNEWLEYVTLKELLDLTDGNLASHLKSLETASYIEVRKEFVGRKPRTTYASTEQGRIAFQEHLKVLQLLIDAAFDPEE